MWRPAFWRFFGAMARRGGAHPEPIEGAETFEGGQTLDVPGRPSVIHTPGHTPGSASFLFERHGALFVGDALYMWNPMNGSRVPQVGPSFFNVSNESCFVSLEALEPIQADVVLPGHGDPWRDGPAAAVASARELGPG
jgi:glyoxylase-like metal-dependent hydrolase (beta-lactamase superfamily II)